MHTSPGNSCFACKFRQLLLHFMFTCVKVQKIWHTGVKGSRASNNIQHITSDHDVEKLSHRIGRLRVILGPDSHRLGSKQLFRSSPLDGERVVGCITNLHGSRNINLGAYSNIKRLQFTGFCEDKVSDISEDRGRIGAAALQPILKSSIEKIYCNWELSIKAFGFLSKTTFQSRLSDNDEDQQALVNKINTMLSRLKTKCLVFLDEVFGQVKVGVQRTKTKVFVGSHGQDARSCSSLLQLRQC